MKLPQAFYRLPVRFDAAQLQREALQFGAQEWQRHPTGYAGNSAIRLITVGGGENDDVSGAMAPTAQLERCPYLRQVLAQFDVVWSRSRLMKLGPRSVVPEHADVNYHWFNRVRIHIPIVTFPEVRFYCGDQAVHMAEGDAWIFDNWRRHRVENPTDHERIHLVADTTGNARFWAGARPGAGRAADAATPLFAFDPRKTPVLQTERYNTPVVMPPAEVELLIGDLSADLAVRDNTPAAHHAAGEFRALLHAFCSDWRELWTLYAEAPEGWPRYRARCDQLRERVRTFATPIYALSNQVPAGAVLDARVLRYAVSTAAPEPPEDEYGLGGAPRP